MRYAIAMVAILVSGCAATMVKAPSQPYRPANYSGAPWNIGGAHASLLGGINLTIDGTVVASGKFGFSQSLELSGEYKKNPVNASCDKLFLNAKYYTIKCMVFVSNERAGTLTFQ